MPELHTKRINSHLFLQLSKLTAIAALNFSGNFNSAARQANMHMSTSVSIKASHHSSSCEVLRSRSSVLQVLFYCVR